MTDVSNIISDEDIIRVHGFASFGTMSPREVVDEGVLKYAMGFTGGWTQVSILLEHGLIQRPKPMSYKSRLTQKGFAYARALWATRIKDNAND